MFIFSHPSQSSWGEGFWEGQNVNVPGDLHTCWLLLRKCVGMWALLVANVWVGGFYLDACLDLAQDSKCLHEWHVAGRTKVAVTVTFLRHGQAWREIHIARQACHHQLCNLYHTASPYAQNSGRKSHHFDSLFEKIWKKKRTWIPPVASVHIPLLPGWRMKPIWKAAVLVVNPKDTCITRCLFFPSKGHPKAENT